MILKKCKVTRLDDTFLRVDAPHLGGALVVRVTEHTHHRVYNRFAAEFESSPHASGGTAGYGRTAEGAVSALLATLGLTADEPRPETAEERVRRQLGDPSWPDYMAVEEDDEITGGDLRAILAELDRLREELEAAGARWHMLSKERDMLAEKLSEQRPVDVDAVLAPLREALCLISDHRASVKRSLDTAYKNGCRVQGSDYRLLGYAYDLAAVHMTEALAKAEKIGRGE